MLIKDERRLELKLELELVSLRCQCPVLRGPVPGARPRPTRKWRPATALAPPTAGRLRRPREAAGGGGGGLSCVIIPSLEPVFSFPTTREDVVQ